MNGCTLKGSKSSMCSPVPMKMMGLPVAATLNVNISNTIVTVILILSYLVNNIMFGAAQHLRILNINLYYNLHTCTIVINKKVLDKKYNCVNNLTQISHAY